LAKPVCDLAVQGMTEGYRINEKQQPRFCHYIPWLPAAFPWILRLWSAPPITANICRWLHLVQFPATTKTSDDIRSFSVVRCRRVSCSCFHYKYTNRIHGRKNDS
jgi:hypothetical protein